MLCTLALQIILSFLWYSGEVQAKVKHRNAVAEEGNRLCFEPFWTLTLTLTLSNAETFHNSRRFHFITLLYLSVILQLSYTINVICFRDETRCCYIATVRQNFIRFNTSTICYLTLYPDNITPLNA